MAVEAPIIPYEKNNWGIGWTLKTLYPSFENVTSKHWKRYIRTLKTLYQNIEMLHPNCEKFYSNSENVFSEHWKRYIRTLKTIWPSYGNVTSELWKRYIRTLKSLYQNFVMLQPFSEKLHPNFENVISELWNVKSELWKIFIQSCSDT